MNNDDVVIISGARTPMGGLQGSLSGATAVELGSIAIGAALERSGVSAEAVDEAIIGCVLQAGLKQGPARQAALRAGLTPATGCTTLNKLCGSGMQAVIYAHDQIRSGSNRIVIAGGMESMSNAPHLLPGARGGVRTGHAEFKDHMFFDGLESPDTARLMGSYAQETADEQGLSREDMDAFAIESLGRAQRAIENGWLDAEIVPVTLQTRKGDVVVKDDEQPLNARLDKIPQLRPAFSKDGTITAANSSSISDGASALLLTSAAEAQARGLKPRARILGHARHSQQPERFTTAPIGAINKLLERTGLQVSDIDLWEINEAFAMVTMLSMRDLGLDHSQVNIYGGACAQGHPIGSTGSRIIVTLLNALEREGKQRGIASLCIGGGEALAVAIERI